MGRDILKSVTEGHCIQSHAWLPVPSTSAISGMLIQMLVSNVNDLHVT